MLCWRTTCRRSEHVAGADTEISVKQSNSIINKLGLSAIAGQAFDGEQFHGMTNDEKVALVSKFDVGSENFSSSSSAYLNLQ